MGHQKSSAPYFREMYQNHSFDACGANFLNGDNDENIVL